VTNRPPARWAGRPSCGDSRLRRGLCGFPAVSCAGYVRDARDAGGRAATKVPVCRALAGATGLEPATSGVTGRFWCITVRQRAGSIYVICSAFVCLSPSRSAWLRRSTERRLDREWATRRSRLEVLIDAFNGNTHSGCCPRSGARGLLSVSKTRRRCSSWGGSRLHASRRCRRVVRHRARSAIRSKSSLGAVRGSRKAEAERSRRRWTKAPPARCICLSGLDAEATTAPPRDSGTSWKRTAIGVDPATVDRS
jgi:hypothetical protein